MSTKDRWLSKSNSNELPDARGLKFCIVVSEWNKEITSALLKAGRDTLSACGAKTNYIKTAYVPGSFELPLGAQLMIEKHKPDAVICIGCVIQGETRHFEFLCQSISQGIKDVGLKYNTPVIFGVLTADNLQQAQDRSGGKYGNKGSETAISAVKMARLLHSS